MAGRFMIDRESIMQEHENIQLVNRIYRNFLDGNFDAVLEDFAEDIDWDSRLNWPGGPSTRPYEGPRRGRNAVGAAFKELAANVRYEEAMAENQYVVAGNRVVVTGSDIRRDVVTGERTENRWSMVWTIENGKVIHFRVYQDTVPLLE